MFAKYATYGIVVIAVIIAAFLLFNSTEQGNSIQIGFSVPLSGDAVVWGEELKKGIELAHGETRDAKISGKGVNIFFEDDKCDGRTSVNIIRKMIDVNGVRLAGGFLCSSAAMSASPIIDEKKVVLLSSAASNPAFTPSSRYAFSLWPSDNLEGKIFAEFVHDELGIVSADIIYINNEYGSGLYEVFAETFEDRGGEIGIIEAFNPSSRDFRAQLTKIKNSDSVSVYFVSNPEQTPLLLKQMQEIGIDKTVMANSAAMESGDNIRLSGSAAEGVYYPFPDSKTPEWFKEKYKSKYGKDPGLLADRGYDTYMLLFLGIEHCGGDDPECVRDYLLGLEDYEAASGDIRFDEVGGVVVPFVIKQVQDGEGIVLEEL